MNPTMEGAEALNPVVQKRNRALSQHNMWQLDFRYLRLLLIGGAIGCSLSYWHERFDHPMTDDAYIQADVIRVAAQVNGPLKKIEVADNQKVRAFVGLQSGQTLAVVLLRDAHQSSDLLAIWQRGRAIAVGLILSFLVIDVLTRKTIRGSSD
jgi:hypothetical protein